MSPAKKKIPCYVIYVTELLEGFTLRYVCTALFTQFYIFDIPSECSNVIHLNVAVTLKFYTTKYIWIYKGDVGVR